jgi:hypothetical protein
MKFALYTVLVASLLSLNDLRAAVRGDIVSYELVQSWDNEQAVEETYKLFEGSLLGVAGNDQALREGLANFLRSYVKRNLEARSLKFYKILYRTIDFDDQPAIASGLIIIPQRPSSICKYGMAVYGHGTLFGRFDAPSYFFENGWYRKEELFFSVIQAAMEYIALVPDYFGMGDGTGLHHHNMDKTNSNSVIDMIRAARKMAAELGIETSQRVSLTGYSEGGTVTMATAKRIKEEGLQSEFPQIFMGPAGGAYDMSGEAYNFIFNNPFYPTRSYILYQAASCQDMYKEMYDPADPSGIDFYLRSPYNDLYRANLPTQTGNVGWVPLPWTTMFNEGVIDAVNADPNHPFRACLERNNTYDWQNPYETFFYYCDTDEQVPPSGSRKAHSVQQSYIPAWRFWERFRLRITELSFGGAIPDHGTCAFPSMIFYHEEMRSRRRNICRPGRIGESGLQIGAPGDPVVLSLQTSYGDHPLEVQGLNGRKMTFHPESNGEVNVFNLDPGLYLYRSLLPGGRTDWDYFIKAPLSFVHTDDYNPVQKDIKGHYFVDISLLEEPVRRLEIYNQQGVRVRVIANSERQTDQLWLNGKFNAGEHIILVVTDDNAYPLRWNPGADSVDEPTGEYAVYTQNNVAQIRALNQQVITSIQLYDIQGKQLSARSGLSAAQEWVDLNGYPAGMYLLLVNGLNSFKVTKQ